MGWSARSGKIVLRIALQRLKRYYDTIHGAGGGTIGQGLVMAVNIDNLWL